MYQMHAFIPAPHLTLILERLYTCRHNSHWHLHQHFSGAGVLVVAAIQPLESGPGNGASRHRQHRPWRVSLFVSLLRGERWGTGFECMQYDCDEVTCCLGGFGGLLLRRSLKSACCIQQSPPLRSLGASEPCQLVHCSRVHLARHMYCMPVCMIRLCNIKRADSAFHVLPITDRHIQSTSRATEVSNPWSACIDVNVDRCVLTVVY